MAYWALIPAAYQVVAILAAIAFLRRQEPACETWPGVSILKPTAQGDVPRAEAIATHRDQDYPAKFEIIGTKEAGALTPNRKVGKLMLLGEMAMEPVWVVNDADIAVSRDYLRRVVATLMQPGVGIVTCLYRATGDSFASNFESLGVATDFMPSVLVARFVGVREFGLGATLAFRKTDLDRIGGFPAIAEYIADDYQLARRITQLGLRAELSGAVVETTLSGNWNAVWKHQVRWARTIRCSRTASYLGLPVTHAGFWALVCGDATTAAVLIALRIATAWIGGATVLKSPLARHWFWLAPLWDVFAFAVWAAAWFGRTVEWGGRTLKLDRQGRIV